MNFTLPTDALLDSALIKASIINQLTQSAIVITFYLTLIAFLTRTTINYKAHSNRRSLRDAKARLTSANMNLATTKASAEGTSNLVRQARARLLEVREQASASKSEGLRHALEQIEEAYEWAQDCNDKARTLVREQQIEQIKASVAFGQKERTSEFWEKVEDMSILDIICMLIKGWSSTGKMAE